MFCRVRKCRHAGTHVTAAHRCGTCGKHGHGQRECGNQVAITRLRFDAGHDAMPPDQWCRIPNCGYAWSHTTSAHATCVDANTVVQRKCPHCSTVGNVNLENAYFTNTECSVCFEAKPCVLFEACRHINVCAACAERLA